MNGNQYYKGEKDGHGWRSNSMNRGGDSARINAIAVQEDLLLGKTNRRRLLKDP